MYYRILLLAAFLFNSGCANKPASYNPNDSFALNAVKAAGISSELKDVEVPKDTVNGFTDSAAFGMAHAAAGYSAPIRGFSRSEMAGMNFAAWLLTPEAASARNSMFAWMPHDYSATTPEEALADLLLEAATKAVKDLGFEPIQEIAKNGADKSAIAVYLTNVNDETCQDNKFGKSNCWIAFAIREAEKVKEAPAIVNRSGAHWFFSPASAARSFFMFPKDHPGFNELEVLLATSKHLPEWVYFYVAPKKVFVGKEQPVEAPMVVHRGKVHYFVKAVETAMSE